MRKLSFLFFAACLSLTACGQHKYNPEAIKLNDSAVQLIMGRPTESKNDSSVMVAMAKVDKPAKGPVETIKIKSYDTIPHAVYPDGLTYEKAISLLNKAIQIDSNYFIAYLNKFNFESHLKRFKDALAAGKEMVRLAPNDATVKLMAGKMYDVTGDSTQAKAYYQSYLTFCDHKLGTMSAKNRSHKFMEEQKAFVLILLDQSAKAHEIFKNLYQEADDWDKNNYILYMRLTRANMLKDQELSITIGNSTTSINNTLFPEGISGSQNIGGPASNKLNH